MTTRPSLDSGRTAAQTSGPLLPRVLLGTRADAAAPFLRLALAIVMFPHGAQKVLGWFGGHGFSATMKSLTEGLGLPAVVALLVIGIEFLGPLLLLAGLLTRLAALGFVAVMAGAIATVHWRHGFFMNWFGKQSGEGFEYHLLALGIAVALLVRGGGSWSLDRRIAPRP